MAQYIVKKGDNLSTIAKKNGIKLNEILKLNKLDDPNLIQIGQKINLPVKVESTNTISLKNNTTKPYKEFLEDQLKVKTPENNWKKITPSIQGKTIAEFDKKKDTPTKQVINKPITKPITKEEEESFFSQIKNKISEIYSDIKTAVDQQTSKKTVAKPKVKIDDSFIDYGYKELGTYKDESFKAGKKDSLLSAMNVFDNDKGFDYIVSPKVKEGKKTFNNVKGVAHFLMDSDITPNQKYTTSYVEKGNNIVKSAQAGKFTPYLGTNPDDYVMYYKNTGNDKMNVKYGQLKDKDKYKGYEQIKVRSIPFGELDFNNKKSAGFAKRASYIGTLDGKQTSIITDPESNDVYGRFSGGSGIFYFKEPKTGKTISVDVSGSVNTIKQVGEELSKKYNVDPKQLQFLYHDMGSYSAKPKSHNGVLSNEQWENYNSNNKGYSGAALMYPMEHGGKITAETIYSMSKQPKVILTPNDIYAKDGANIDLSNTTGDRKVFSLDEFKKIVPEYQYQGYLYSGIGGKYKDIDKTKYPVLVDKLQDGTITYRPYTIENAERKDTTFNEVQKMSWGGTPFIKNNMEGYAQSFAQQPQSNFPMYPQGGNFYNEDYSKNLDRNWIVPQSENYMEGLTNSNKYLDHNASGVKVGFENMKANIAGTSNPLDTVLGGVNMTGDLTNSALSAFAKPDSKASAYVEGSQMAQSVVKPLENIPIVGQASKLISGIIGGALSARKKAIENEEQDKQFKLTEYLDRNLITAKTPSYYEQYHAKYGANPKMMEQRIIDDIYSDFDKYLKIV